jgi:hypothetical protein
MDGPRPRRHDASSGRVAVYVTVTPCLTPGALSGHGWTTLIAWRYYAVAGP